MVYTKHMQFDWMWFFIGLGVVAIGVIVLRFYHQIADATRTMNYSKWQFSGVVIIIVGFFVALNLHTMIINAIVNLILSR